MKCGFYSPWDATDASMTILSQLAMFFVLQAMQLVFNFVWTSLPLLDGNFGCVVCMYLWWSAYVKVVIITFVCSINFNLLFLFMLFLVYQNTHTYPNTHSYTCVETCLDGKPNLLNEFTVFIRLFFGTFLSRLSKFGTHAAEKLNTLSVSNSIPSAKISLHTTACPAGIGGTAMTVVTLYGS